MSKQRIHNEWFQPIKKTTCSCGQKKTEVYSWGEYIIGKWRTVDYVCQTCFASRIVPRLIAHAGDCGCTFSLNARSGFGSLPKWLKMPEPICKVA